MTKIVRFECDGVRYGELRENTIYPLDGTLGAFTASKQTPVPLGDARLLAPVIPQKIVAVGPNYHAHLKGRQPPPRPHYWIKPPNTLLDPEGVIEIPDLPPTTCHESELAVIIGSTARNVSPEDAPNYIFGYTCINDVSGGLMHDPPSHVTSQWMVDGKIYDTFGPLGPCIETELDTQDLEIQCRVNGEVRQRHRTSDMIWTPVELVSLISHVVTLFPGDVVATGSPPGVAPLRPGDVVEVEVEGIGVLRNHCAAARS